MSPKLPHLTAREVVRFVEAEGFAFDHQTGSHAVYRHSGGRRVTIPTHSTRTVGLGLLAQILRDADIDPNDVRR